MFLLRKSSSGAPRKLGRLLVKTLALFGPLVFLLAWVNVTVDPGGLYTPASERMEFDIADSLEQGLNVTDMQPYSDRLIKRDMLNEMAEPFDTLVLGSSRGYLISADMLGESAGRVFNLSVTGGCLEDFIGQIGVLHQSGLMPRRVVLSLDPWACNDNWGADLRWQSAFGDGYYYYVTEVMGHTDVDPALADIDDMFRPGEKPETDFWQLDREVQKNAVSISYFQASLRKLAADSAALETPSEELGFIATPERDNRTETLRADGSFSYPKSYREASVEKRTERAYEALPAIMGMGDYPALGGERFALLRDFVSSLRVMGVEVDIFFLPMSTALVEYMAQFPEYFQFFEVESFTRAQLADTGAAFYGTYDPLVLGLDMNDFYDGYHATTEVYARLLAQGPN